MNFKEAIDAMRCGAKVKRRHWDKYWRVDVGVVLEGATPAILRNAHLFSDDWEVVEDTPKPQSLEDVLPAMREGKRIRRRSWARSEAYFQCSNDGKLAVYNDSPGSGEDACFEQDDLVATDWVVLPDEPADDDGAPDEDAPELTEEQLAQGGLRSDVKTMERVGALLGQVDELKAERDADRMAFMKREADDQRHLADAFSQIEALKRERDAALKRAANGVELARRVLEVWGNPETSVIGIMAQEIIAKAPK